MHPDAAVVRWQLGRAPRGRWRVVERCPHGHPRAIAVAPLLDDGTPFPTLFWLTCPMLVEAVGAMESACDGAAWAERIAADPQLADAVVAADTAYRAARRREGGGTDPCAAVGLAGQSDKFAVKCLHARVAARLGGVDDPVGAGVLASLALGGACDTGRCGADADGGG